MQNERNHIQKNIYASRRCRDSLACGGIGLWIGLEGNYRVETHRRGWGRDKQMTHSTDPVLGI